MIRIWGCDYDSHAFYLAGLPAHDDESDVPVYFSRRFRGTKETSFDAIRAVPDALAAGRFTQWDVLFIEHGYGANRKSDWPLARVQGAITACAPPEVAVNEISLPEWRKRLTGKGSGTKAEMELLEIEALHRVLGTCPSDPNLRAALGMAWVGRELNRAATG